MLGEILAETIGGVAAEEIVLTIFEIKDAIASFAKNVKDLIKYGTDFKTFAKKLCNALHRNNSAKAQDMMNEAQRVFATFNECDTDGNGAISKSEFVHFYAKLGISLSEALEQFDRADSDGNGEQLSCMKQVKLDEISMYAC